MYKCYLCENLKRVNLTMLCNSCMKNPFNIEKIRDLLARKGDVELFKKTYSKKYPQIKNLNTSKFWNKKLSKTIYLKNQDGMTKDRINIAASIMPKTAKKVLDIGIGNGFLEEILSKNNEFDIFGFDISSSSIKDIKNRFKGNYSVNSIYKFSYPKDFFDVIFVLEVLEHISPDKIFTVLNNIKKILKKNGTLIISIPINEGLERMKINPSGHVRTYTKDIITTELRIVEFKIASINELYAFKQYYSFKKILANLFHFKWKPNNLVIKTLKI